MPTPPVPARTVPVLDSTMHYREAGSGQPVLFLHGNPTSSHLWREVLPAVAAAGNVHGIAVDLIGMGQSGKPPIAYRMADHIRYLDAFITALDLHDLVIVAHDWGVALGLHYLARHPGHVRAICFMEGHIHPIANWSDFDPGAEAMFRQLREPKIGRRMILHENFFIEAVLPSGMHRVLTETELEAYRAPYREVAAREPIWRWVQEIPIAGEPADVSQLVTDNQTILAASPIPKLLFHADPGAVIGPTEVAWCETNLRNLTTIPLGPGLHFLPEDHPHTIATGVTHWLHANALT